MKNLAKANDFINTARGNYIVAQALYIASKEMKKVPAPHTEYSNISDMEFLLDNLFSNFKAIFEMEEDHAEIARRDFERKVYEECDKEDREEK
jgi:hypothetical protein